jgi:hypothetical protein
MHAGTVWPKKLYTVMVIKSPLTTQEGYWNFSDNCLKTTCAQWSERYRWYHNRQSEITKAAFSAELKCVFAAIQRSTILVSDPWNGSNLVWADRYHARLYVWPRFWHSISIFFGAVKRDWLLILALQTTFNVHYFFYVVFASNLQNHYHIQLQWWLSSSKTQ